MNWEAMHYNAFGNQESVDECVAKAEKLAEVCIDEESALELLKCIEILRSVEQIYFVPEIVMSWEEMALSYIDSDTTVFDKVHYPQMQLIYQKGHDAFRSLEIHTKNKKLPKDAFFGMIQGFNMDVKFFNKFCKQYGKDLFRPYVCQDKTLYKKFLEWKGVQYEH